MKTRFAYYFKTLPALLLSVFLLTGCGPPNTVNTPEDVEGKVIGARAGTPSIRLAADMGAAVPYDTDEAMMADLRSGAIDCVIMESTTAQELVLRTRGVRILLEPIVEYDLRFAVPRENGRLLNAVNGALEELQRNGTLRGLYSQYFARSGYRYRPPERTEPLTGSLTVALPPDSPPYSYKDADGMFTGMDVEVAIALGDVLGVEMIPIEYDPAELASAVWHGRADLALGWTPDEGEGIVDMSEPYAEVVLSVVVRR